MLFVCRHPVEVVSCNVRLLNHRLLVCSSADLRVFRNVRLISCPQDEGSVIVSLCSVSFIQTWETQKHSHQDEKSQKQTTIDLG